jgi:cytochrome bd ubiquinol oxidase subunit I
LRTASSVSPSLTSSDVALSFLGYAAVYLLIYPTGLILMLRLIRKGATQVVDSKIEAGRPEAPVLARAVSPVTGDAR